MKGILFNVVEDAIVAEHGEDTWDRLLDEAGLDGAFTAVGDYPDGSLFALVAAGSAALDVPAADLTRRLGQAALGGLAQRYPHFFTPHTDARSFLLTLNDVIHPEVRKLHKNANPPEFWFDADEPAALVVHYRSERGLCALAEGMILGTGTHYDESVTVEHVACAHEGADHCILNVTFARG